MYYLILVVAVLIWLFIRFRIRRQRYPYPPGPPADPIIGHLRKLPSERIHDTFKEWGQTYGDVMHLWTPNANFIVLNSDTAANDLLHKMSSKCSSRPRLPLFAAMGWDQMTTFLPYGRTMVKHRRLLNQHLFREKTEEYFPAQLQESRALLKRLLFNSEHYEEEFSRFSCSTILKISCGHEVTSEQDPYLEIAKKADYSINHSGPVGNTVLDYFPFLRYFPSWFPGAHYPNFARQMLPSVRKFHDVPFEDVLAASKEGHAKPSFLASNLQRLEDEGIDDPESFEELKGIAATLFIGGADTTAATLCIFLLLMVLNPESLKRGQQEIDEVVGRDRLPDFGDRDRLPYIECILRETTRWYPIVANGVPHMATEDVIFRDMFVPKGSLLLFNTRGIMLDEKVYHNPHLFLPERYLPKPLGSGEPYAAGVFGYGRRICPGRFFGLNTTWIVVASMIAAFDISKAVGEDGKEVEPLVEFSSGLIQIPKKFNFVLKPRSLKAERLVLAD